MEINTQWLQVLTVIGANFAAFMWARKESADDRRQFLTLLTAIQFEIKDFHGRLCAIEERRK